MNRLKYIQKPQLTKQFTLQSGNPVLPSFRDLRETTQCRHVIGAKPY